MDDDELLSSTAIYDGSYPADVDRTVQGWRYKYVDYRNPHPMVAGYTQAILEEFAFKGSADFHDGTYAQMVADCAAFFYTNRDRIGELVWFNKVEAIRNIGYMLWKSRTEKDGGFKTLDHEYSERLHTAARYGMSRVWAWEYDDGTIMYGSYEMFEMMGRDIPEDIPTKHDDFLKFKHEHPEYFTRAEEPFEFKFDDPEEEEFEFAFEDDDEDFTFNFE